MYTRFEVQDFRGIQNAVLEGLAPINLITGSNNFGKTALLEAIFLHACGPGAGFGAMNALSTLRGRVALVRPEFLMTGPSPWDSLFRDYDLKRPIILRGQLTELVTVELNLEGTSSQQSAPGTVAAAQMLSPLSSLKALRTLVSYGERKDQYVCSLTRLSTPFGDQVIPQIVPQNPGPVVLGQMLGERIRTSPSDLARRYSTIRGTHNHRLFEQALKIVEPRLQATELLQEFDQSTIHLDIGGPRLLPISLFGSGLVNVAEYLLALYDAQDGILLIDEIDNGIHYSILEPVWGALSTIAKSTNTQVVATTHSSDCITAALKAFADRPDSFHLYRATRQKENPSNLDLVDYDQEALAGAMELGLEVR